MSRLSTTLVMPNYNHSAFIDRSLPAVLRQRAPVDEIIVVDDASTDDSLSRIEALTAGDARVRIVRHLERMGAIATINHGLELASTELVAFPAADDLVFPDLVHRLEPLMRANPEAAFACAAVEIRDGHDRLQGMRPILWPALRPRYVTVSEVRRQLGRGDNFYLGAATLYRRARVIEHGGFEAKLGSLADGLMQRTLAFQYGFCFDPAVLGVWRHHQSNYSITSVTNPATLESFLDEARHYIDGSPAGSFPPHYAELYAQRLRFSASRLVVLSELPPEEKAERVALMTRLSATERRLLSPFWRLGSPGRKAIMTWLTLRFRPYSLFWLASEPVRRLWARHGAPSSPLIRNTTSPQDG